MFLQKKNILTALLLALFLLFTLAFSCISHTIAITKTGPAKSIVFHFAAPTTLTVGNTGLLSVFVQPFNHSDGDVVWTTNPENLLTIIPTSPTTASYTAVGIGTVVITASVGNDVSIESESIEIFELELVGVPAGAVAIEITNVLELRLPDGSLAMGVRWSSSHPGIVEISETTGIYRAISAGTVTIFYTYGTITRSTTIEVTGTAISISIDSASKPLAGSVNINDTGTLTATVTPINHTDGTIQWSSSNREFVTIDAQTGKYTAVGIGTATITARIGSVSDTTQIQVLDATGSKPAQSIAFNPQPPFSLELNSTGTLSVAITPSDHTDGDVVWMSDNTNILTITVSSTDSTTATYNTLNLGRTTVTATLASFTITHIFNVVATGSVTLTFVNPPSSVSKRSPGTLYVAVTPENHGLGIPPQWMSNDTNILKVTSIGDGLSAEYSGVNPGSATVTVTLGTASVSHYITVTPR